MSVRHRIAALVLGAALVTGCHHHVRLIAPGAQPAQQYVCVHASDPAAECQPATVIDPAALNPGGSVTIDLPAICQGVFESIIVLNADTDHPEVHVTCGAVVAPVDVATP